VAEQNKWVARLLWLLVVVAALIFLGWPYALVIGVASVIPALLIRRRRGPWCPRASSSRCGVTYARRGLR